MTDYAAEVLRGEITKCGDALAGLEAEKEQLTESVVQLNDAIQALLAEQQDKQAQVGALDESIDEQTQHVRALKDALARLEEATPTGAADPGPVPPKRDVRTRTPLPDLDAGIRERHEAEELASKPRVEDRVAKRVRDSNKGRFLRDPGTVHKCQRGERVEHGKRAPMVPADERLVDLTKVSPTNRFRAELVADILEAGACSQREIALQLQGLLDGDPEYNTVQAIVSRVLPILATEKRAIKTGLKGEDARGAESSPIWKLLTPTPEPARV